MEINISFYRSKFSSTYIHIYIHTCMYDIQLPYVKLILKSLENELRFLLEFLFLIALKKSWMLMLIALQTPTAFAFAPRTSWKRFPLPLKKMHLYMKVKKPTSSLLPLLRLKPVSNHSSPYRRWTNRSSTTIPFQSPQNRIGTLPWWHEEWTRRWRLYRTVCFTWGK